MHNSTKPVGKYIILLRAGILLLRKYINKCTFLCPPRGLPRSYKGNLRKQRVLFSCKHPQQVSVPTHITKKLLAVTGLVLTDLPGSLPLWSVCTMYTDALLENRLRSPLPPSSAARLCLFSCCLGTIEYMARVGCEKMRQRSLRIFTCRAARKGACHLKKIFFMLHFSFTQLSFRDFPSPWRICGFVGARSRPTQTGTIVRMAYTTVTYH